ncbi:hypothetical protein [Embleya sp. MST-111070]|uniref:hypothetical protein n=1 Tax=Embleya sp. MST-111070 TaxID=3398231 RepID=UPI003F741551
MTEDFPEYPPYSIVSGALDHALLTNPFPLQASPPTGGPTSARLGLVVSAPPGDPVRCSKLVVEIPIGTSATSLVDTATGITATPPAGWQQAIASTPSTATVTFTPPGGEFEFDQDGAELAVEGLRVNTTPGNAKIRIVEHVVGQTPTTLDCDITKGPYRPPIPAGSPNRLSARRWAGTGSVSPTPATQVAAGQKVTLTWQHRTGVERRLFTQPLNAAVADPGRDVSLDTRFDSAPLVRPTTFTLRTKVTATGEVMYDTVTVTVDSPTFAGLRLKGPLAGPRDGSAVVFPDAVTVNKGLAVQGTVTARAGLTALGTFEAKQELAATAGITVTGSAEAGGSSTVPGGQVTVAAGTTTTNLTAKGTVKLLTTVARWRNLSAALPDTDVLLLGYVVEGIGMPNLGRVDATVADRIVRTKAKTRSHEADAIFLPIRAGERLTHDSATSGDYVFFAVAVLGRPVSS